MQLKVTMTKGSHLVEWLRGRDAADSNLASVPSVCALQSMEKKEIRLSRRGTPAVQ